MTFLFYFQPFIMDGYFITKNERSIRFMKKMLKRLCTGFLALATVVTALPTTPVHAESKQYWTESKERVGIVEKVMNDGSIGSTFNEGHLTVEGEDAYCIDINTDFKNGYKTRADASTRMSADQISDVALSIEYVKQYTDSHNGISKNHAYLLRQLVVWQRLSVHLGWQCDNVRASYDEIPKATQDEVFAGAKAFVKENKGRYECGGYIYSGEGQELGQFWAKLNVGNAKLQKTSSNTSITDGNGNYSIAGATYGVFADKDCTKQLATHDTDNFPIAIGEYVSIEELNEMYEMIEELPDYIVECLDEFISHYGTLEEVVEHKDDIYYYPDCETMTDVAYYYIDELQALGDIPPSLQNYIDYEAYGRDLDMGGCFIETSRGMCEIPY
jgi:antirestriction protein